MERKEIWLKDSGKGYKNYFRYAVFCIISNTNGINTEATEPFTNKKEAVKYLNKIKKDWKNAEKRGEYWYTLEN